MGFVNWLQRLGVVQGSGADAGMERQHSKMASSPGKAAHAQKRQRCEAPGSSAGAPTGPASHEHVFLGPHLAEYELVGNSTELSRLLGASPHRASGPPAVPVPSTWAEAQGVLSALSQWMEQSPPQWGQGSKQSYARLHVLRKFMLFFEQR
eukprot:8470456-Lingulodinium_polyedra.AAC.1